MAGDHRHRVGRVESRRPKTWQEAMAARRPEEWLINDYAVVQATMGKFVTGLAFLAVTLSTVVLLGGFISEIQIKDFWYLTGLSFVLVSTVLTVYDMEPDFARASVKTMLGVGKAVDRTNLWFFVGHQIKKFRAGIVSVFLYLLTYGAIILYMYGPGLCFVYSGLRLAEHYYGDADGDAANKVKLWWALLIFYSLVLLQTICFYIWMILQFTLSHQVHTVVSLCGFGKWGLGVVRSYIRETKVKCTNDLRLPSDWNLMTYAVGLLETASPDDQLTAARVLDALGRKEVSVSLELQSSRRSIQHLIGMLGWRSPDGREMRERAARIIADVSGELHIAQFPGALQCISSLLDASQQEHDQEAHASSLEDSESSETCEQNGHDQRETLIRAFVYCIRRRKKEFINGLLGVDDSFLSKGPKELISQGGLILERLTQDQDNCREICRNQGLLLQITAPITSKTFLDTEYDNTWVDILSRSLSIVSRLVSTPGETRQSLRREIGRSKEAAHNMLGILESENNGYLRLQEQAIEILAEVALDMPTVTTKSFIRMLRCIFLDDADNSSNVAEKEKEKASRMRKKAGEALAKLLCVQDASNSKAILEMFWENGNVAVEQDPTDSLEEATRHGNVVHQLTDILVKNKTCQISAAEILEGLCSHFTKYRELPKQDVINLLTQVLGQVLSITTKANADAGTGTEASNNSAVQSDVESQPPRDADRSNTSSKQNDKQSEEWKLLAALLSLTTVICDKLIDADDFARVAAVNEELVKTLKEMIDNNNGTTADCLRILKLITQVVITTIRHKPSCIKDFEEHNFKESLSKALKRMSDLDNCMLFSRNNRTVVRHFRSVSSLVKEAQDLLDRRDHQNQ